jgi:hypothetical protein
VKFEFSEGRCESLRVRPLVTGEANKVIHAWRPTDIELEPCVLVLGGGEVDSDCCLEVHSHS